MTTVTPFPRKPGRRLVRSHAVADKLAGAADDLTLIAAEHEFDRDGVREVAFRLRRMAAEMKEP